jgi:hypothetical protein
MVFGFLAWKCFVDLVQEEVEYIALPAENCQHTCEPAYEPIVSVKSIQNHFDSITCIHLRFSIPVLSIRMRLTMLCRKQAL